MASDRYRRSLHWRRTRPFRTIAYAIALILALFGVTALTVVVLYLVTWGLL